MEQQKVSLTLPRDVRERIDAERRTMSQRVGAELSFNQAATALLRRALDSQSAPAN
ncbi:hypothetical protein KEC55_10750 [Burkholderia cepacia]|uniref:hypothetical protein n=1 Tax=Burkholderia cepacia TaxID=292 RepID=UPI0015865788|nr:hypothetical protein [Burkholderia cepacia]WGY67334.1 hypothetical protein KEC55_10750 [Burkholderia cepacia]